MELAASPAADLVALLDPAARGPAPLLRPAAGETASAAPQAPFDVFLALLGAPMLAGEPLPVTGKDLPPSALELALDAGQILTPMASPTPAPLALAAELGIRAGAVPADSALPVTTPVSDSAPLLPAGAPLVTAPSPELALLADAAPQGPPVATPPPTPSSLDASSAHADAASTTATPSWLDELLADSALRAAPAKPVGAEQRAAAAQSVSQPSSPPPPVAVIAPAPDAAPQLVKVARDELPRAAHVAPVVGDAPVATRADWLPSSTASTTAPSTPAQPTVAPPSTPVDVRVPNWQEAFAGRVQWLVDNQVGEARIKLNPPELGAIDVKISHVDEKSYVQLTAASAAARDELANGLHRLRELFSTSGLTLGGASVESGTAGYHDARGEVLGEPPAFERPLTSPFAEVEAVPRVRAAGRIDVFA